MNVNYDRESLLDEISVGDSCYVDDQDVQLDKLTCRYTQRNNFKGITRKFALYDKTQLVQQRESPFNKVPEHRIDLTFLDPEPTSKLFVSWKMLLIGVAMLGLAVLLFLYGQQLESFVGGPYVLLAVALLTTTGLILLLLSYYRSYLTLVFHSETGKIPLLVISRKFRDEKYRKFVDIVGRCINYSRNRNGISVQDRLRGEMKDLWRLKELGVVSVDDYTKAQTKILAKIT